MVGYKKYDKKIVIDDSITKIMRDQIKKDVLVEEVVLPRYLLSIEEYAFNGWTKLKTIIFPDTLTTIGERVFGQTNIDRLSIGKSLTNIRFNAFSYIGKVCEVTVDPLNPSYIFEYGSFYSKNKDAILKMLIPIGNQEIPFNFYYPIKRIGEYCFEGVMDITKVVIPESCEVIEKLAFCNMKKLKCVFIPSTVKIMNHSCFFLSSNAKIYCEAESAPSGWATNWNKDDCPVKWGVSFDEVKYLFEDFESSGFLSD